jgi:hypothetical protein
LETADNRSNEVIAIIIKLVTDDNNNSFRLPYTRYGGDNSAITDNEERN